MTSFVRPYRTTLLILLILTLIAGCSPKQAVNPPDPTMPAVVTPSPSAAPTETATPEPTPTITPSPYPSPTPEGFITLNSAGFSITAPAAWEIEEQTSSHVVLSDSGSAIFFMIESRAVEETSGVNALLETLIKGKKAGETIATGQKTTVDLADGVKADKLDLVFTMTKSTQDVWLIQTQRGKRSYDITIFAPKNTLVGRQGTIDRILKSISLFDPRPFGLPRQETLVMLGNKAEGKYIDPATATSSAADYVGLLFSGLVRLAPNLSIIPDLAEKWTIDSEAKIYTFTLRKGIAFSNGDPITAQAFKDSWERACDPKTKSTTARTYLGDIVGVKEKLDSKADQIAGVKVLDELILQVTLDGPKPYFLAKLTYPAAYVVDTRQAGDDPEKWVFSSHSSGPFKIKSAQEYEGLVFERNPSYWQPAGVTYLAFLESPSGSPLSLYEEGTLDILGIGGKDLKEVSLPENPNHAGLHITASLCTQMILLNPNLPPMDDPMIRQALILATDRPMLIEKLTEGSALLANGILPPAMPGTETGEFIPADNAAAAREALAKSKYAGQSLQITLTASGYADSQRKDVALLADQWQKVLGIKVKVEYLDPDTYTQAARRQPGNAILYGWCADYPDPENFLDVLFHSNSDFNLTGLKDAEINGWLEKARTEASPEKRLELYRQVQDRLLTQGYVLPLFHNMIGMLVKPRVSGYTLSAGEVQVLPLVKLKP